MMFKKKKNEIAIKVEELPALTENEQLNLVEIKDELIISRLTSSVPGIVQTLANTAVATNGVELVNAGVYTAILPSGAKLVNSQQVEGAVRGFFRGTKGIEGQANFLSAEGSMEKIASMNIANAAMGAASMIVGQYYMKQINEGLAKINEGISQICDFQDTEYKSKILTLMAQVRRMSEFKSEIMENTQVLNEEISRLHILEKDNMELLNQANLMIDQLTNGEHASFDSFSKNVANISKWQKFQIGLLDILYMVSDLNYIFHLGSISRNQAYTCYEELFSQTEKAISKLKKWHAIHNKKFGIDTDQAILDRTGIDAILHKPLGLISSDFKYKQMSKQEVVDIRNQVNTRVINKTEYLVETLNDEVKVVIKEGKLFYLSAE